MLTVRVFDEKGRLVAQAGEIPDDTPPETILDHAPPPPKGVDPRQSFYVRVENEKGKGYWLLLGSVKTCEIGHPRCRERKN